MILHLGLHAEILKLILEYILIMLYFRYSAADYLRRCPWGQLPLELGNLGLSLGTGLCNWAGRPHAREGSVESGSVDRLLDSCQLAEGLGSSSR